MNAICEFGQQDVQVNQLTAHSAGRLHNAFEQTLEQARQQGELAAATDLSGACDFLMATLCGMKIASKGGVTVEQLERIAGFALRALNAKA